MIKIIKLNYFKLLISKKYNEKNKLSPKCQVPQNPKPQSIYNTEMAHTTAKYHQTTNEMEKVCLS